MEIDSNVKDLSFVMEDMVIEENEEETLSRRMDEKIRMKSNRKEAEDVLYDMKLNKRNERKNQIAKKEKLTATLNIVKKRKQQVKDSRKKLNKQNKKKTQTTFENEQKMTNKNVKEVPENCKKLVKENDVVYVVPGNGACGPNSAAAFLFQDEIFGPRLCKKKNIFSQFIGSENTNTKRNAPLNIPS